MKSTVWNYSFVVLICTNIAIIAMHEKTSKELFENISKNTNIKNKKEIRLTPIHLQNNFKDDQTYIIALKGALNVSNFITKDDLKDSNNQLSLILDDRLTNLENENKDLKGRIQDLESVYVNLPKSNEISKIENDIQKIKKDYENLSEFVNEENQKRVQLSSIVEGFEAIEKDVDDLTQQIEDIDGELTVLAKQCDLVVLEQKETSKEVGGLKELVANLSETLKNKFQKISLQIEKRSTKDETLELIKNYTPRSESKKLEESTKEIKKKKKN